MEEEEDMLPTPPFWDQANHRHRRRLRRSYSLLLTSTSLLVLLLVTTLVFTFIVVPTLHSFASHIFKPHSVKKSWDSLNLVLVLFAIVCGFLSKNNTTEPETVTETPRSYRDRRRSFSNPATPRPWFDQYEDRTAHKSFSRLRSFNSYPDLRLESPWVAADERWRFYDDTNLEGYLLRHRQPRPEEEEGELGIANVAKVASEEVASAPPPPPPPPATRTKAVRRNAKRTYQAEMVENRESNGLRAENSQPQPSTPPPPPPPPPLLAEGKNVLQGKKKRGIATKEFLTSLTGKKKKQRQRSVENFESILNSETFSQAPPSAPPPSPPPPVFHKLFSSKNGKHKKRHLAPAASHNKPRISNKRERSNSLEHSVMITGNESPLIPIPPTGNESPLIPIPPPPPPPFKMPAWKFRVQGDFVRIDSIGSSRSGSPDSDGVVDSPTSQEVSQCNSPSAPDDGISLFCPSPDVDTKAHTFIERFRAGLRMEKMNSIKGTGRSNLGTSPNPETKEETRPSS